MSDLKPVSEAQERKQLALVPEMFREVLKKPLRLLPQAVRPAALAVWACHRHLKGLESPLSLSGMMAVWIGQFDLRPDDAADVLNRMLDPERVGTHKFASDLTSSLANEVAAVLRKRRQEAEQQRQREEAERDAADALPADQVSKALSGLFTSIGRSPRS